MVAHRAGYGTHLRRQVLSIGGAEVTTAVGAMSPEEIFKTYARSIGIGGIAMAGIIGIIRSWGIIKNAVGLAAKELKGDKSSETETLRTQRDLSFRFIAIASITALLITFVFFWLGVMQNLLFALVAILLVTVIASFSPPLQPMPLPLWGRTP